MAKETGKRFNILTPLFDTKAFSVLEAIIVNEFRKITFDKSNPKMANGQSFPQYSTKGSGVGFRTINGKKVFIDSYANRKKTGKLRRQNSSYSNSLAPVLTGDLMLDTNSSFSVRDNAIYIGWTSHANKLEWLRKNKRILTSKEHPINPKVIKKVMPSFNRELKRRMPKGKHTITIGKKK